MLRWFVSSSPLPLFLSLLSFCPISLSPLIFIIRVVDGHHFSFLDAFFGEVEVSLTLLHASTCRFVCH